MENIREAFFRVRQDIEDLRFELDDLKSFIGETREKMKEIQKLIEKLDLKLENNQRNENSQEQTNIQKMS